jgi:hypothetical protein
LGHLLKLAGNLCPHFFQLVSDIEYITERLSPDLDKWLVQIKSQNVFCNYLQLLTAVTLLKSPFPWAKRTFDCLKKSRNMSEPTFLRFLFFGSKALSKQENICSISSKKRTVPPEREQEVE